MYPFLFLVASPWLKDMMASWWMGDLLFWALVTPTLFLLPDAVGFIVWETKENWSLYRSTRPRTIRAVPVGGHGETIRGLLHPGFHSGTVPKYYARLRAAERAG